MRQGVEKRRVVAAKQSDTGVNTYLIGISVAAVAMSLVSMYAVVVVLFGLLPGLIAMIIDQDPKRFISKIVLSFNAVGIIQPIVTMMKAGGSKSIGLEILIEPQTWLMIYSAASIGWAVYWIVPQLVVQAHNIKAQLRIQQLTFEMDRLTVEWGDEIKSTES